MDRRGTDNIVLGTEQLDGPRHAVVVGDAIGAPGPIELVDVLKQASVAGGSEDARKARARQLVVEMQPLAAGDSVRPPIAHVPPDSRHAGRDPGGVIGANVDVGDNVGRAADGLHVEANPDVGVGQHAVE